VFVVRVLFLVALGLLIGSGSVSGDGNATGKILGEVGNIIFAVILSLIVSIILRLYHLRGTLKPRYVIVRKPFRQAPVAAGSLELTYVFSS
jgi:hypothetical protein